MGFQNEKDHPEVAPSQFEMNFSYAEANIAADQVQLYKLLARQVAAQMGLTASFLPKPVAGVNGNGMHTNLSLSSKGREPVLREGRQGGPRAPWPGTSSQRILTNAQELCLILNPSVNAYRRLDPHFEAPNQIKVSRHRPRLHDPHPPGQRASRRAWKCARWPRTPTPTCNLYGILRTGLEGPAGETEDSHQAPPHPLPARQHPGRHPPLQELQVPGGRSWARTCTPSTPSSSSSRPSAAPRPWARMVKACEIQFHHEVTNQYLWSQF